eukprot:969665-Amphidinium_carterae.4
MELGQEYGDEAQLRRIYIAKRANGQQAWARLQSIVDGSTATTSNKGNLKVRSRLVTREIKPKHHHGEAESLEMLEAGIGLRFQVVRTARLGRGAADDREAMLLNRILSVTADGILIEPDPRHAWLVICLLYTSPSPRDRG